MSRYRTSGPHQIVSKMAAVQTRLLLLVLLGVCVAGGTACPSQCTCREHAGGPPTQFYVDCSGRGLQSIPTGLPPTTKSLNMANNELTAIDGPVLAGLTYLTEIDLSGNSIQEVPLGAFRMKGDCNLEDFVYNRGSHVRSGRWDILDLTEPTWPCAIDLRNNPISKVKSYAFAGSQNFTLFLGGSSTHLTIEGAAFQDATNVIGLHISDVPSLNIDTYSFVRMENVGWVVIDRTRMANLVWYGLKSGWLRISNSLITDMPDKGWRMNMDVQTDCYVKTYQYGPDKVLTESMSTIHKGGIEIINNTLPVLPSYMFHVLSNTAGVYFKGNKIAGFQENIFKHYQSAERCILRFDDNDFETLPSGSFGGLGNVVHVSISGGNLASIEENAFADSSNIGSLSISVTSNEDNDQVVVKPKAFANIDGLKIFSVTGIDALGDEEVVKPRLLLQPHVFNGLNVDYMAVNLYNNMHSLANDLFTGLSVKQVLTLRVKNLKRIGQTAFGKNSTGTHIERLNVIGMQDIPCHCEKAELNVNITVNVREVGLHCSGPLDNCTISHAWPLDDATSSASCCLQFSLALVILISLFLNF